MIGFGLGIWVGWKEKRGDKLSEGFDVFELVCDTREPLVGSAGCEELGAYLKPASMMRLEEMRIGGMAKFNNGAQVQVIEEERILS